MMMSLDQAREKLGDRAERYTVAELDAMRRDAARIASLLIEWMAHRQPKGGDDAGRRLRSRQ
jgi:hypothetical protein